MRIKLSLPKLGLLLSLLLIGYQNISAMIWQYSSNYSTIVSFAMLVVAVISLCMLMHRPISKRSVTVVLLVYYLYIMLVCFFNGYLQVFMQEPTLLFTATFWIFNFWLFEEIAKQKNLTVEAFVKFFFTLTVVCFALFCQYYLVNIAQVFRLTGLNIVYYITFMLPIVLMSNNKKVVSVGIVLNLLAALMSGKRGALIAVIIALIIWMQTDLKDQSNRKKLLKLFLYVGIGIVAIFLVEMVVDKLGLDILQRMESLVNGEDSGGNGRTKLWTDYWEYIQHDGVLHNIFGRGYAATKRNPVLKELGMGWAHNDFLQILFDYGIIGIVLFCIVISKLFISLAEMRKFGYCYYKQFLISLMIFLLCCCLSMVTIYPQWFLAMAAFWGYLIGDFERERGRV